MRDAREFFDCQNCRCLNTRREAQRLTRAYDDKLRPLGLTINQFSLLTTLILAGPLPVAALAERLGIDRTTLTRNLALGEKNGLVETVASPADKRVRRIKVTEKGLELAERALPAWREVQAAFTSN